jgi:hypothetical protein
VELDDDRGDVAVFIFSVQSAACLELYAIQVENHIRRVPEEQAVASTEIEDRGWCPLALAWATERPCILDK